MRQRSTAIGLGVLVAEGNAVNDAIMSAKFRWPGARVAEVTDGTESVRLYRKRPPAYLGVVPIFLHMRLIRPGRRRAIYMPTPQPPAPLLSFSVRQCSEASTDAFIAKLHSLATTSVPHQL